MMFIRGDYVRVTAGYADWYQKLTGNPPAIKPGMQLVVISGDGVRTYCHEVNGTALIHANIPNQYLERLG